MTLLKRQKWLFLLPLLISEHCAFARPLLLEINPLFAINQGLGLSAETAILPTDSIGLDLQAYFQLPYHQNGVQAQRNIYSLGLKWRSYFWTGALAGPFVGLKILYAFSNAKTYDTDTAACLIVHNVSPIVQAGYRFLTSNGFSVSLFVGGGVKLFSDTWPDSLTPDSKKSNADWIAARQKLNQNLSRFQPDYGITFGYAF